MPALAAAARAAHQRYCRAAWQHDDWTEPPNDTDPAELAHLIAADCLLAEEDRQRLLEETCPALRLRLARRLLHLETEILGNLHAVPMQISELEQQANLN
jgi:hypothetical protein